MKILNLLANKEFEKNVNVYVTIYQNATEHNVKMEIRKGKIRFIDIKEEKEINAEKMEKMIIDKVAFIRKVFDLLKQYQSELIETQIEEMKLESLLVKNINEIATTWKEITDYRKKIANETKEKAINVLNKIDKKLQNETQFNYFLFYSSLYSHKHLKGEVFVNIVWRRDYGFIWEIKEMNNINYEIIDRDIFYYCDEFDGLKLDEIKSGESVEFEKLRKQDIKNIAKQVKEFVTTVSKVLISNKTEEEAILNIINNIETII